MSKNDENNGWICLHRAMRKWQHYGNQSVKAVFIELLFCANSRNTKTCERGATLVSIRNIAANLSMSVNTIRKALDTLEKTGEIQRIKVSQNVTKTIIINYQVYQNLTHKGVSKNDTPNAKGVSKFDTRVYQNLTPNNNIYNNNIKEKEKEKEINPTATTDINSEILADIYRHPQLLEQFCMAQYISLDQFKAFAEDVVNDWAMTGQKHNDITDAKKHLLATIRIMAANHRERKPTKDEWQARLRAVAVGAMSEIITNN